MKIQQFFCEQVHGYLSFGLTFQPDLTFLTGINGSGKTTAVRAITALLTPSLRDLANMDYRTVGVTVEHAGRIQTIKSQRSEEDISVTCTEVDEQLRIPVLKPEAYEPRNRFLERERDFYREQEAINVRNPTLVALERLPTPMFLDLERRHQGGARLLREAERFQTRIAPVNPLAGSRMESLGDAQNLAEHTHRQFLAVRAQLTDELKQNIILTAFELDKSRDHSLWEEGRSSAFLGAIENNENVVHDSLSQIGIAADRIEQKVKPFFEHVREVAKRLPTKQDLLDVAKFNKQVITTLQDWSAIQPQVQQIRRLAKLIEDYNVLVRSAFDPVNRYLHSVNSFLSDSRKELSFDRAGTLQVTISGEGRPRPISALSSGERQLVVILTHLAFNRQAKRANVLIIDEPELSLHLRWQELFVDSVTRASPGVQLILATHSPSIIKGRVESCVDVEEARTRDRILG